MEKIKLKAVVEALLFASAEPLNVAAVSRLIRTGENQKAQQNEAGYAKGAMAAAGEMMGESPMGGGGAPAGQAQDARVQLEQFQEQMDSQISAGDIREVLHELAAEYQDMARGFELMEVGKAFQFRTKEPMAAYVRNLYKMPKPKLSSPSMETLAIVAYQQSIGRAQIEQIRGVDSGGVLKTLLEKDLVRIVGRSEEPGRPILYGTTNKFLEIFSLAALSDLPTLKDLESLDQAADTSHAEADTLLAEEMVSLPEADIPLLDDSAGDLIAELENSMQNLKNLEDHIFTEPPKAPSSEPSGNAPA